MDDREAKLLDGIAAIWQKSLPRVREQLDLLEEAVAAMLEGSLTADLRRGAEREAHRLAGSAGSFGFREGSERARELELMLAANQQLDPKRAAELVLALRTLLDRNTAAQLPTTPSEGREESEAATIFIVGQDERLANAIVSALHARGHVARHLPAPQLIAEVQRATPALILLDLDISEGEGLGLLDQVNDLPRDVPVVVLNTRGHFADRVEAARHGVRAFLQKPLPADDVADALTDIIARACVNNPRVLAVDDDPAILALLAGILQPAGFQLHTMSEPTNFWQILQDVRPDVLLLDYDMPEINGIELLRVVRGDPKWVTLPVIFVTSRTDSETIAAVFNAGADDFIRKPIVPSEVIARIRSKAERSRLITKLTDTDYLTGLPNRRKSEETILAYQRLSDRYQEPLSIALLDLDNFKRINDQFGHAVGDEALRVFASVLANAFRGEDVIGRWGGEEFAVGMYGMYRDDAVHRLGELLESLKDKPINTASGTQVRLSFSGGVAEHGADGRDLMALMETADQHLQAAKKAGKGRIVGTLDAAQSTIDVLVVEDDETLAELLVHALETRGYRVALIADGQTAADELTRTGPQLRPRVVLLDVDLPGMDGISVLRTWKQAGVLTQTRVIMLTVRSAEPEVVEALKLDAFDHVAKPFSTSVLMQRIRRAMQP